MRAPSTAPADTYSPDPFRAGPGVPPHLPDHLVHLLARLIALLLRCWLTASGHRARHLPSWWHFRPDLPPGSAQQEAAAIRGNFGTAIAWMCRRRGIGPGHPDWPYLARTIAAFGGSLAGFRPGLPARGLQWWENPRVIPGVIGDIPATPAADALAALLTQHARAEAPPPALSPPPGAATAAAAHVVSLTSWRQVRARAGTGPPTGPPAASAPIAWALAA